MRSHRTGPGGPTGCSARSSRPGTPTASPSAPRARCGPERSILVAIIYDITPAEYRYWVLTVDPPVATLTLEAAGDETDASLPSLLRMDIELADALERLRFEYPEVGVVVMTGATERAFRTGITGVPPGTPPDVAAAVQMYRDEVRG